MTFHTPIKCHAPWIAVLILAFSLGIGAGESFADESVEQWKIFEAAFSSSSDYENPVQDVSVNVEFKAPSGRTSVFHAFWNGGRRWLVRFSPNETGPWRYKTACSDANNAGLHNQTGAFECQENGSDLPFYKHGELRLSQNRRYIEHQDGAPFFWLADTVWCGPALADYEDWLVFLQDRADKQFTAIQFVVAQWRMFATDAEGNATFTGHDRIAINPAYFQRLDQYFDAINQAGLVAVPVVLWAIRGEENPGYSLPVDQRIVLADYIIARYGAHQVVWFLGGDGDYSGEKADPWKKIGRAVFHDDQRRLATMHVCGRSWAGEEFRREPWFHFISYQSGHGDDEKTFRWLNQGPPSAEWDNDPPLPVINTEPNYEAHNGYTYRKVHNDFSVRRAAYWSLLVSPTAGVTYGGQGIWGWHEQVQAPADHLSTGLGSPWHVAKDLPGALCMKYLHQFFQSIDWQTLSPAPELLTDQPGREDASKFIACAKSGDGKLAVIYMPEGGEINIQTSGLAKNMQAKLFHPRTGGWIQAGTVQQPVHTVKTPDRNDWILLLKDGS
ncbi:MAG: DUF4038 domain-containing protein [Candidatus Omnitrophica bacterium]|nr:DUF4038 domain-containing protein [Candidatus Omnitrophota bacterium]